MQMLIQTVQICLKIETFRLSLKSMICICDKIKLLTPYSELIIIINANRVQGTDLGRDYMRPNSSNQK